MRQISLGRATLSGGTMRSDPVTTSAGSVAVEARGVVVESPWGGLRWLGPTRVEALHADGRRDSAAVRDVTQRVLVLLFAAGFTVAWSALKIQRRWRRPR